MSGRLGWAHIRAYCTCGAKLDARSEPPDAAEAVHDMFRQLHCGEGHRPCDAATARRARKRTLDASSPDRRPGQQPTGDRQSVLSS